MHHFVRNIALLRDTGSAPIMNENGWQLSNVVMQIIRTYGAPHVHAYYNVLYLGERSVS